MYFPFIQNKNLAISYINLFKSTFRIKTIQDHDCYCSLKTTPVLCAGGRHRVLTASDSRCTCAHDSTRKRLPHTLPGAYVVPTRGQTGHIHSPRSVEETRGAGARGCPLMWETDGQAASLPPPRATSFHTQGLEDECVLSVSWLLPTELRGSCELLGSINLSIISAHRDQTQINGNTE